MRIGISSTRSRPVCRARHRQAHCDPDEPADLHCGDDWDHTAVDPESRLLLSLVPGKRTAENCQKLVDDVQRRTGGRTDILYTSDEHAPYLSACGTHRQARQRSRRRTRRPPTSSLSADRQVLQLQLLLARPEGTRTLRLQQDGGSWKQRTPAMAAGLPAGRQAWPVTSGPLRNG